MATRFLAYVRGLMRRRAVGTEVDDELRFHVDQEVEANIARGMSPSEARRAALRDLGGMTTISNKATGEQLFDSTAFGAGAGLRVLVHKHSRSNLCVDVAFGGDGSHGLYIGFRDAF